VGLEACDCLWLSSLSNNINSLKGKKMSTTLATKAPFLLLSFHLMQQTKTKQNVTITNMAYNENFITMRKKKTSDTISTLT
jgi:ABC-type lipoprotein export system ATPase subunit